MELSQSSPFRGAVKEKPYLTLRILQVPLDVTLDTLDTDLKSITVTDTDLHEAVNTLSHLTLVQMNKNSACATATFQTSLPKDEFVQRLQAAIQKDYQFDCNFYDITPLYDHQTDANTDLVAVSGLGGHGFGSWKDPTSDMMWLRDNLPKDIPHQRVIIYGHDTHLQGSDSKQSIEELGVGLMESITRYRNDTETSQRPIIFIGHSLGGLIIKEALLFSRNSRIGTSNIHKACHGMLFFGVPNHGLRYDQLSTIVQGQPNKALVESLLVDSDSEPSDYLKRISNQFSTDFEGKYSIISFYERKHTPTVEVQDGTLRKTGKPSLLVTKESATKIGVVPAGREDNIPFNTDHSGLVKYRKGNSRDYDTVRSRLERVIDDATTKISRQSLYQPASKPTLDCLKSLAFTTMDSRQHTISTALEGTCTWLRGHESFKRWASRHQALLWIKGNPGSGKSTLLKYALSLEEASQTSKSKDLIMSFFFHGRGDELQRTRLGFYRSLLYQLVKKCPGELSDFIRTFIDKETNLGPSGTSWLWHEGELRGFLKASLPKVLRRFSITLFVDAVDEVGETTAVELVEEFKGLVESPSQSHFRFRICFSCRHYPILETDHDDGSVVIVEKVNQDDIKKYVESRLHGRSRGQDYASSILSRAAGIFLWAQLVVQQVLDLQRNGNEPRVIHETIKNIPHSLDELYQRLIESVRVAKIEERWATLRLIQWICFAKRPLRANELQWAMAVKPDRQYETLQDCRQDFISDDNIVIRVNALSCGLAKVDEGDRTVQFTHQSVKDFFIEKGLAIIVRSLNLPEKDVSLEANCYLAQSCLQYIAMGDFDGRLRGWEGSDLWKQFPLLRYAIKFWILHAQDADGVTLAGYLLSLFERVNKPQLVDRWVDLGRKINYRIYEAEGLEGGISLHVAARYGLTNTASFFVDDRRMKGKTIDPADDLCQTPLFIAANSGHTPIVQLLLESGADVNLQNEKGETPLFVSAKNGYEPIVRLLLETEGVDADLKDNEHRTPLWEAARLGCEPVLRFLIQKDGVDADSRNIEGRTPLWMAAFFGYESIVRLLLEADGVDADSQDDRGRTPLWAAATWGHEPIVRLLLETGGVNADPTSDYEGKTALRAAAEFGHDAIVEVLLEAGAEVNSRDGFGQTPLWIAADKGHKAICRLLVDAGADVNAKDRCHHRTPLFQAIINGNEAIVRMLLEAKADVHCRDSHGSTPLHVAQDHVRRVIARVLCEYGADRLTLMLRPTLPGHHPTPRNNT